MGVDVRVLPMSDDEVTTRIVTDDGREPHYEEFLARDGAQAVVRAVRHDGAAAAAAAPGVPDAIAAADLVVLCPSNPSPASTRSSPSPVSATPRAPLRSSRSPRSCVAPRCPRRAAPGDQQGRAAVVGRAARDRGGGRLATGDLASRFVLDTADADEAEAIRAHGLAVTVAPTLQHLGASTEALLAAVLDRTAAAVPLAST